MKKWIENHWPMIVVYALLALAVVFAIMTNKVSWGREVHTIKDTYNTVMVDGQKYLDPCQLYEVKQRGLFILKFTRLDDVTEMQRYEMGKTSVAGTFYPADNIIAINDPNLSVVLPGNVYTFTDTAIVTRSDIIQQLAERLSQLQEQITVMQALITELQEQLP